MKITDRIVFNGVQDAQHLPGMTLINDENYYNDRTYITNSMLGKLDNHPEDLKQYLEGGLGESSSALSVGDALHKGMLEPEKFEEMVVVWNESMFPDTKMTLRAKVNKDWYYNFLQENKGKCILKDTEYMEVKAMLLSLKSKPEAMKWLENAVYEQIALANVNGVAMKSKGDILRNDEWLIDIKTTSDISLSSFKKSCEEYGYYRQAGMYSKMFDKTKFGFLIVEKKAPYKVAFYEVSPETLERGVKEAESLIEKFKYYFSEDDFFSEAVKAMVMDGVL